jgi:sugar phosphate isomerase/epimerase
MPKYEDSADAKLGRRLGLNRRQFLAATTGLAATAAVSGAVGPLTPAASAANGALVPPGKRGIILYTVRDAIARDPASTNLASGFREVLGELAGMGYKQVEFAGYRQSAGAEGGADLGTVEGAQLLKQWLDDNGLEAEGNHGSIPSTLTPASLAQFDAACEVANILGLGHIGTGGDPTRSSYKADWDLAAEHWDILGKRAAGHGLKLYTHNHDSAYDFLLDSGPLDEQGRPTRSSGIRRLEYFLANTDPDHVYLEMDIYWAHVAQHRFTTFVDPDGVSRTSVFNPLGVVQAQPIRFPLFHAKDGRKTTSEAGYEMVPFGTGDIDYRTFFASMGAKGYHNSMYEQDNAAQYPTPSASASLDNAALSYQNLAALRG